jgi:hypothetical protein
MAAHPGRPAPGATVCAQKIASTLTGTASVQLPPMPLPRTLCPIRAQAVCCGARLRWSGPYEATLSGAVCAGSNPAWGAASNTNSNSSPVTCPTQRNAVTSENRTRFPILCPMRAPDTCPERGYCLGSATL